jgi:hypothetical protein
LFLFFCCGGGGGGEEDKSFKPGGYSHHAAISHEAEKSAV